MFTPRRTEPVNYPVPTNYAARPPADSVLWEGYIKKLSTKKIWQVRLFVLTTDHLIYLHDKNLTESHRFDIKEVLLFTKEGAPFTNEHNASRSQYFFLETPTTRRINLQCNTVEVADHFMRLVIKTKVKALEPTPRSSIERGNSKLPKPFAAPFSRGSSSSSFTAQSPPQIPSTPPPQQPQQPQPPPVILPLSSTPSNNNYSVAPGSPPPMHHAPSMQNFSLQPLAPAKQDINDQSMQQQEEDVNSVLANSDSIAQMCHNACCGIAVLRKSSATRTAEEKSYVHELDKLAARFDEYVANNPSAVPVFGIDSLPLFVHILTRGAPQPQQADFPIVEGLSSLCRALGMHTSNLDESTRQQITTEYLEIYAHIIKLLGDVGDAIGNPDLAKTVLSGVQNLNCPPTQRTPVKSTTRTSSVVV